MSTVDTPATDTVASQPVAPTSSQANPESTPGPADTAANAEAKQEGETPEQKQSRRDSRAFATQRREIRELNREIGALRATIEGMRQPPAEGESQPQQKATERSSPHDDAAAQAVVDKLEEAGQDIDGFDKVIETLTTPGYPISVTMRDFLGESDHAAPLAQWLASNRGEALRIARLSPAVAVKALEKAEARLSAKPAPKITKAPAPPPAVTGGGTAPQAVERMSHADLLKLTRQWSQQ